MPITVLGNELDNIIFEEAEKGDILAQICAGALYDPISDLESLDIRHEYNAEEAIKWYNKAYKQGNYYAAYRIGLLMSYQVPNKGIEGMTYIKEAAQNGCLPAMNFLANCYYSGSNIELNHAESIRWYCISHSLSDPVNKFLFTKEIFELAQDQSKESNSFANCLLGVCYEKGYCVEKNGVKSMQYLWDISNQPSPYTEYYYSKLFLVPLEEFSDSRKLMLEKFIYAADRGCVAAQQYLGYIYYDGFGKIKPNYKKAVKWLTMAAKNGDRDAQWYLGECYKSGKGVKKDSIKALYWYQKSIESGDPIFIRDFANEVKDKKRALTLYYEALILSCSSKFTYRKGYIGDVLETVGDYFYEGIIVNSNYKEALKWYELALYYENSHPNYKIAECYFKEKNYEVAIEFYRKSDNSEAYFKLANCYYDGLGTEKNREVAFDLYLKAAEGECIDAMLKLGDCYYYGEGTDKSVSKAIAYYSKAAERGCEDAKLVLKTLNKGEPTNKDVSTKFKILEEEHITFSNTHQEIRFTISDVSQIIKYRIDGGETITLSSNDVAAGVCKIELPQRDCMLTMWCVDGEPHMIRYCYDREESVRKSSTLYILAIGLNDYQDPNLGNLRYAEKDARDVIEAISKKHRNTFANIDAQLLVGKDVTSSQISEKINYLADKASASDMAVIFFAGHGLVDERDRYYLSTYNVTDASTPRRGGYSSSTFVEDISYINCKLLVFIDACYSGKLLEGYRGTVSSENFFREMNSTPNGTCIYTSSSKDVKSRESAEHKHGIFTQALIESFEFDKSDHDKDNRITVIEVRNYLEKRIPQLTGNKQKPIYRNIEEIDFPLFIK